MSELTRRLKIISYRFPHCSELVKQTAGDKRRLQSHDKRLDKRFKEGNSDITVHHITNQGTAAAEAIPRIAEVLKLCPRDKNGTKKVAREAASFWKENNQQ